jgi:adenosylmethionine-8-amino-7-oxononanoate aminotransferase
LNALQDKYDMIGDVRGGHGLMLAMELVSDRAAKTPIDKPTINAIHRVTYESGAMVRVSGNNVILSPALILSEENVETILTALDAGLASI